MATHASQSRGFDSALRFELGIRNLDGLIANLYKIDPFMQDAFREAAVEAANDTAALTSMLAPVDTGFMSEHVAQHFTPSGFGFEVGWDAADFFEAGLAFYPFYQEFGTRKMSPQPSLGPAWDEIRPQYEATVSRLATQALARAMAGGSR
jgi:HK97 gp10 family phage protein